MSKYRIELELDYDDINPDVIGVKSKSHVNALMRNFVGTQIQTALMANNFKADVYKVRKVNS